MCGDTGKRLRAQSLKLLIANDTRNLDVVSAQPPDGFDSIHQLYEDCAMHWEEARTHGGQVLRDAEYNLSRIAYRGKRKLNNE